MNATVLEACEVLAMPRIHDELWDKYGPGLQAAKDAARKAQDAVAKAFGDWAP